MRPQIVIDMNLTPDWAPVLQSNGWEAVHWSEIGDRSASDHDIMAWARTHGCIVFTHDLDFGTVLALTRASGPSVLQVRTENTLPNFLESVVIRALTQHEADLSAGAMVVVDERRSRVRVLPI